jgi:hypothetical protein
VQLLNYLVKLIRVSERLRLTISNSDDIQLVSHSLVFRIAGEANSTSSRETSHQPILNNPVNKESSFLTSSR